ncbi:MAG TPA: dephospho-CoA kinase [Myxococcota bacterium]|nr:dephospho-CoA kinase [Myxococcota bacterium]HQK52402.1 dephospho-CoA kinase [Myxococcota bacterium]
MRIERPAQLRLVGLTGGIGSGKSAVAACWRSLGIPVIDADAVARRQSEPGGPAVEAFRDVLGPDVLGPDGRIDRRAVAAAVFQDPDLRRVLEDRLHPLVIQEVSRRLHQLARSGCPLAVIEAALLIETGLHRAVDRTVVVTAPEDQRIARVCRRDGLSAQEVQARMAAQFPDEARIPHADSILRNDGLLQALLAEARRLALELLSETVPGDRDPGRGTTPRR